MVMYITCIGEAQKASLKNWVGGWRGDRETQRERQRRGGWATEPEKGDGLLFQAPSLPKALLHLAPGL